MKIKITPFQRKGLALCCLALSSLLLINCSSKDLEFIDPYEFVNTDFDEVEDLEPVVDEDQEIEEPDAGEVEGSEDTQAIVNEVTNLGENGEVSEETKEKLQEVETFTEQFPEEVKQAAQNINAAAVDNILDETQEMSSDIAAVRASLSTVPASVRQLLPKINFTVNTNLSSVREMTKAAGIYDLEGFDIVNQSVTGPCADAARQSYNTKVAELQAQRDANFQTIDANYTRRMSEADTRYGERVAAQRERYAYNKANIKNTLTDLLAAAEKAAAAGNTQLETQLKQLTLLYAVDARAALEEWNILVLQRLEDAMAAEKAWAETRKAERTSEVTAAYNTSKAAADAKLQEALNSCHNQGSGN